MSYLPENIIQISDFQADPDVAIEIGISQIILLMPIFKWQTDHWVDATGDYDLCMSDDYLKYYFTNKRATSERFAYRYFPVNWLARRLGR